MCHKILCGEKSEKFYKIFWELNNPKSGRVETRGLDNFAVPPYQQAEYLKR
jgi:hypothetical protein